MRCFLDFKPGGSLCHIFATLYRYKAEKLLEKFDFDFTGTCEDIDPQIKMAIEVQKTLINVKCIRLPIVYIRPEVNDTLREQIAKILKEHQGEITEDKEEATHIIYPEIEANGEHVRPSFKRGTNVMIHWYRRPESYDTWMTNTFDLPVCIKLYIFAKENDRFRF